MIRYHIFLVEDDVYFDFFYKTDLLNQFFTKYMSDPNREDLRKQFNYITCPVPRDQINTTKQNIYITERIITVFSNQQLILDNHLLNQLEKLDRRCFIVDHTNKKYGWLTPKKHKFNWTKLSGTDELDNLLNQTM